MDLFMIACNQYAILIVQYLSSGTVTKDINPQDDTFEEELEMRKKLKEARRSWVHDEKKKPFKSASRHSPAVTDEEDSEENSEDSDEGEGNE